ncbi:MAG: PhzF family phenazine biosynthesis protein, partial [Nocardioidaceae bacterium]
MPRMLEYDVVDVFTDRAFTGNPLAVVYGAEDLSDAQLAAVAREFNLSETTFPSAVGEGGYAVRIFTPSGEVPFAGHPTLGTAWALRARGALPGGHCVQHCGVGAVGVELPDGPEDPVALTAAPRDLPVEVAGAFAEAVGLAADDVAGPVLASGCGLTFVHLPVHQEALARARPAGEVPAVAGVADP